MSACSIIPDASPRYHAILPNIVHYPCDAGSKAGAKTQCPAGSTGLQVCHAACSADLPERLSTLWCREQNGGKDPGQDQLEEYHPEPHWQSPLPTAQLAWQLVQLASLCDASITAEDWLYVARVRCARGLGLGWRFRARGLGSGVQAPRRVVAEGLIELGRLSLCAVGSCMPACGGGLHLPLPSTMLVSWLRSCSILRCADRAPSRLSRMSGLRAAAALKRGQGNKLASMSAKPPMRGVPR